MNNAGWITLNSAIYDYIAQSGLSEHKYFQLFHIAFRVMEQLGLNFFYEIRTQKLPINPNKTVTLPADCQYYNKAGIFNGNGELIPLRYNDKISSYRDTIATRIADTTSPNFINFYSYSSPIFYNYWNNGAYGNLYGIPTENYYGGGFKVDEANRVIVLDPNFSYDSLVLEYTASPKDDQDYYIPVQFREAVIAWLRWQTNIDSAKSNSTRIMMFRHEYFEARRLGIRDYRPFYLDQAYIQNVNSQRLVVKV